MPEFEETDSQPNPSHNYTPSTDASKKPRGRRRSCGFKTEVASTSTAGMGEVSAADALKSEKLSGSPSVAEPEERPKRERKPRAERSEHPATADVSKVHQETPAPAPEKTEPREKRAPREPREERITNPQPSEATLASIEKVEASIAQRRAERDARRAEREKNSPAKSERKPNSKTGKKPQPKGKGKQPKKKGLLATLLGFFGIGNKAKPAGNRSGNRGGKHRQGGNRRPQNRQGGNRGGQNRRGGNRGGQGRRQGGNKKPHSAQSLSNES